MISIIIPTYNRAHLISRAIKSVINQTYKEWELIISDDGSSDDTEQVVNEFLKDERIRYLKNKNAGATAARNKGANIARGTYLTFLDSDDEAEPEWLAEFNEKIKQGAKVVCCGYSYFDHNGKFITENSPIYLGEIYLNKTGRFTNGGVFLLKKSLFNEIGGYDENVKSGQHSEMALRLVQVLDEKNIEIVNIYKSLINVHVHEGEKIRNDDKALFEGTVYTLEKHLSHFKKNPKVYRNYLSIAALGAFKINKIKEAQSLFYKAWSIDPFTPKVFLRFIISHFPALGRKLWM